MWQVEVSHKSEMAGPFNRGDTIINKHFTFLTPRICFCDSNNKWRRNLKAYLLRWPAMLAPNHHQTTQTTSLTSRICIFDIINNFRTNVKAFLLRRPANFIVSPWMSWKNRFFRKKSVEHDRPYWFFLFSNFFNLIHVFQPAANVEVWLGLVVKKCRKWLELQQNFLNILYNHSLAFFCSRIQTVSITNDF